MKTRPKPTFVCPICNRGFRTREAAVLHVRNKHRRSIERLSEEFSATSKEEGMTTVKK